MFRFMIALRGAVADLAVPLFYFGLLVLAGIFVRDIPDQPDLLMSLPDFINSVHPSDPTYFATGALDFAQFGSIQTANLWLISLWPPGLMFLEGMILRLFGKHAPFILILLLISCAMSAGMLALLRHLLARSFPLWIASFLPILIFCFPVSRFIFLQPSGLVLGEAFALLLFVSGVILLVGAGRDVKFRQAVIGGIMIGGAAYFRSQFEALANGLLLLALLFGIGIAVLRRFSSSSLRSAIHIALIAAATAQISMLPWRVHNYLDARLQSFGWVQTQSLVYRNAGLAEADLAKIGGGFVVAGGGALACRLDTSYCGKGDAKAFYLTFANNVGEWYRLKLSLLPKYWFSSIRNLVNIAIPPTPTDLAVNSILLIFVIATFPLFYFARRSTEAMIFGWVVMSFYAFYFLIISFVHFEARYFFLLKIFSIFSTLLLSSLVWRERAAHSDDGSVVGIQ